MCWKECGARLKEELASRDPASSKLLPPAAELVIFSRERIDHDGPRSAGQSARFQVLQRLGPFQPRELHQHLLRSSNALPCGGSFSTRSSGLAQERSYYHWCM